MKKCVEKIFIGIICFSLFFSNVSISANAGGASAVKVGTVLLEMGKEILVAGAGHAVENLVDKWFSGEKEYYDAPSEQTIMDYYANNSAINKATGNISHSGANNENCYNTFSSTVTDKRTYSLIKDSYNTTTNNYTTMLYNPITNNYTELNQTSNIYYNNQYDTYYIENNEYNYYVTNNYTYVSYYITNNETNEESYYEIYYEMPDGRSSYDLEKEDVWGEYFIYDIANYEFVAEDDGTTLALYHFDGDGKDSSFWKNDDATLASGVFTSGKFGQGLVIGPSSQLSIHLKNELDVKNFTLEMILLNSGNSFSNVHFMIEDTVFLRNNSIIKNGINSLVFQGGNYDIDSSVIPIKNYSAYYSASDSSSYTRTYSNDFGAFIIKLGSDTTFYCNGEKISFTPGTYKGALALNYKLQANGQTTWQPVSEEYAWHLDLVSAEKYIPDTVSSGTGIYIFKDSIVIKNTTSNSFVLDELRVSNSKLYSSDTISVPSQPFDTNMVLTVPQNPTEDMIAIRGNYEVADCRIGGVRPTYPSQGDVYIYLEDDIVKDVQQYEGDAWYSVVGAIYQNDEWHDLKEFDMSTYTFEVEEIPDDSGGGSDDDTGDDSSGGSVSGNGTDSSGSGISDLLDGIGKIFDTILSLIGKIMGVVADFSQSVLDLFSGFTTFTDGFNSFLTDAFGFIPKEIINAITVGISLAVILVVIRFLRG